MLSIGLLFPTGKIKNKEIFLSKDKSIMPLKKSIFRLLLVLGLIYYFTFTGSVSASSSFYVDPKNGKDSNSGSLSTPFKSLEKALQVVSDRVDSGIRSDKIYLRGGRYRSSKTLWQFH